MHKENVSTSSGSSTYNASTRWVLESKLRQIYAVAGPSWSSTVEAVEFGILSNDVGVDSELKKTEKKDDDKVKNRFKNGRNLIHNLLNAGN